MTFSGRLCTCLLSSETERVGEGEREGERVREKEGRKEGGRETIYNGATEESMEEEWSHVQGKGRWRRV